MNKNKSKNTENIQENQVIDPNIIEFEKHAQMQKEAEEKEEQFVEDSFQKKSDKSKKKTSKAKVAVASFVLLLAVGIGGNWYYDNSGISSKIEPILGSQETKTLGEAEFVDATTEASTENQYFSTARVERQTARDESLEKLQAVIDNTESTEEANKNAAEEIAKISNYISIENKIETLVTAKGVDNCLAVISTDGTRIDVIVDVSELNDQTIMQIKDIAMEQLNCSFEDVSIIQAK